MAKQFWASQEAVGKRFHFFGDPTLREVVGVVGNTVNNNIGEVPAPLAYLSITQDYSPAVTLQVHTTGSPEALIAGVRAQIQSLDRNLAITNVQTISEIMDQGLWAPRMGAALLTLFGGLALVLAALGVYGVLSYSVNQQTREIGIRMAMGADRSDVLRLVVGQGLWLAGIGVVLGVLVALGGNASAFWFAVWRKCLRSNDFRGSGAPFSACGALGLLYPGPPSHLCRPACGASTRMSCFSGQAPNELDCLGSSLF